MKQFSDNAGRSWTISLTISVVKRIRDLLGVNLLEIDSLISKLNDVVFICDVIYVAIKQQADSAGVTDEQFGQSLGGEVIKSAQEAFYGELTDFFQKLGRRDLSTAIEKHGKLINQTVKLMTTQVEMFDIEAELAKIEKTLGPSSTSSPVSSA